MRVIAAPLAEAHQESAFSSLGGAGARLLRTCEALGVVEEPGSEVCDGAAPELCLTGSSTLPSIPSKLDFFAAVEGALSVRLQSQDSRNLNLRNLGGQLSLKDLRRGSQVVRQSSAKASFVGSIPTLASNSKQVVFQRVAESRGDARQTRCQTN